MNKVKKRVRKKSVKKRARKINYSIDLLMMIILPIIAFAISILVKANSLESIILFLILPATYLSIKGKKHVKKSLIFSAIVGVPMIIIFNSIAHLHKYWIISSSVIDFRFLLNSVETIIWGFLIPYFIIMFYEYFIDKNFSKKPWKSKMNYLVIIILTLFFIFAISFLTNPTLLKIPYFYLVWGIVLVLMPIFIMLIRSPSFSLKFFFVGIYFTYFFLIYEITALKLKWWEFFDAEYMGWLNIFGVSFPIEELLFCILFLSIAVISYYEYFIDDNK